MQILTWLWVAIAVVLLFGAAIFVHEFGHFLVARWCGLKVEGFSIGFGPKLFGWRRGGIEYALRAIPAGGYVRLPQMVTSEAIEGKADAQSISPAPPGAKIIVSLAGPAMNAVFAFLLAVLIYFVGLPVRVNPAVIGWVTPGSPEEKQGIHPGDRIVSLNGKPVTSWDDLLKAVAIAPTNTFALTIEHQGVKATHLLTATPNEKAGLKMLNLEPLEHPVIGQILPGSAAQAAGLKTNDEVISFSGVPIVGQEQLVKLIRARPGQTCEMELVRQDQHLRLNVTPATDPKTHTGLLGMSIMSSRVTTYELQLPGPPPWQLVGQVCADTLDTLKALLQPKKTGVSVGDLSGPPGILAILAIELKADLRLGLRFMVLLNINLAILNLLPLPVLDGGHIAMALVEKLRGRPLNPRVQEYATTLFAFLLISFMLYVSYNDVVRRFPLFRTLFNQEVQINDVATNAPPQRQ